MTRTGCIGVACIWLVLTGRRDWLRLYDQWRVGRGVVETVQRISHKIDLRSDTESWIGTKDHPGGSRACADSLFLLTRAQCLGRILLTLCLRLLLLLSVLQSDLPIDVFKARCPRLMQSGGHSKYCADQYRSWAHATGLYGGSAQSRYGLGAR